MTSTFTVAYIIIAILLWIGINAFVLKRKKRKQVSNESFEKDHKEEYSQLKSKDDDSLTVNRHQKEYKEEQVEQMKQDENNQPSFKENVSDDNNNSEDEDSVLSDRGMEIHEEEPINEQIKKNHVNFVYGKGITRNKILIAMMFGMFIAILNQTLLNVALPVINNEFSISASTGQWLMTGFMLVNGILIPISAFLISKYSYRKLFIIAMILFTIGSFICALSVNFPMMMTGRHYKL